MVLTDITLMVLAVFAILPLVLRPARRFVPGIFSACMVILLTQSTLHAGNEWVEGSGILRGIPRIFMFSVMGSDPILSWTPLELLLLLGLFLHQIPLNRRGGYTPLTHITYVAILGMGLANTLSLLSISGTLLLAAGLYATIQRNRMDHGTVAGYAAVLMFAVFGYGVVSGIMGANQGYGTLFSPAGYGGVLDLSALAVLRHASFSLLRLISVKYAIVAPLLMGSVMVVFSRVIERSELDIRSSSMVLAVIMGIKLFPLLELGFRYTDGLLLMLVGSVTIIWSVLSGSSSSPRASSVALGGSLILIGGSSPVGAVLWIVLWLPGGSHGTALRISGMTIFLLGMIFIFGQVFEHAPDTRGIITGILCISAAGIGITGARLLRRRCYSPDVVGTLVVLILAVASTAIPGWPLWGDKLRLSFLKFSITVPMVAISVAAGWIIAWYFSLFLRRMAEQTVGVFMRSLEIAAVRWIIPFVDICAVLWVALERFLWQGITLFGPRRLLYHISEIMGWFDARVILAMRRIPEHVIIAMDHILRRIIRLPGMIILIIVIYLVLWNLGVFVP